MSLYSIEFKPLSVLTKIPDAQTIFGAFCYKYKEIFGENKLNSFLVLEKSASPIVLFSSMFYKNILPIPQNFRPPYRRGLSLEETSHSKKIKKIKYFSKSVYLDYTNNKENFEENFYTNLINKYKIINNEILSYEDEQILDNEYIVKDYRTRNAFPNDIEKRQLFKEEVFYCNEKLTFNIYINILNEDYKVEILEVFKSMNYVFFGGYKSIGYNLYQIVSIEEETKFTNKMNMLISKSMITDSIDINNSYYSMMIIKNKFNTQGSKVQRKQLNVFLEGSVIKTDSCYIGGLVEEEQDGIKTYQYYLGMLI